MKANKKSESILNSRPILVIANSSWYINHYRSLLLEKIANKNKLITMAPVDESSIKLSKDSIFIPWRVHRSNDLNIFSLIFSFLKMMLLVRAIKPKLIHSHTLKTNLLSSIVAFLYGIPIIISFSGMGRLSKSKGFKLICFKFVLNLISFFSIRERNSRFSWTTNYSKSYLIFQNPIDKNIFDLDVPNLNNHKKIIPGSGLPNLYFRENPKIKMNKWIKKNIDPNIKLKSITLIYCGRLLKSKGIYIFIEILKSSPNLKGIIFGSTDPSSKESISEVEIDSIKQKYKNIKFLGNKIDPLLRINEQFPIVLVPSEYGEGLPRTILESLSLKIPVICSKQALSGIFDTNQLNYTENNSPQEYFKQISLIVDNYKNNFLKNKLDIGYNFVKNKYSEENIVKSTMTLYSYLLDKNNSSYLIKKNKKESFWLAQ